MHCAVLNPQPSTPKPLIHMDGLQLQAVLPDPNAPHQPHHTIWPSLSRTATTAGERAPAHRPKKSMPSCSTMRVQAVASSCGASRQAGVTAGQPAGQPAACMGMPVMSHGSHAAVQSRKKERAQCGCVCTAHARAARGNVAPCKDGVHAHRQLPHSPPAVPQVVLGDVAAPRAWRAAACIHPSTCAHTRPHALHACIAGHAHALPNPVHGTPTLAAAGTHALRATLMPNVDAVGRGS